MPGEKRRLDPAERSNAPDCMLFPTTPFGKILFGHVGKLSLNWGQGSDFSPEYM